MDPKLRFSSRVENYIKYRPRYPQEIIEFLIKKKILKKDFVIADIGSGTGILSNLFLENGNIVYGVEPNKDMRTAAENFLKNYPNFISIDGSAEDTGLKDKTIDMITAGQAFHWFNIVKTKEEFRRILKQAGWVVLIWNNRKRNSPGFPGDYEQLILKYGKDYKQIKSRATNIDKFFKYQKVVFPNHQDVNIEEFKGRINSTSYIPLKNEPIYKKMIIEFEKLFNKYQENEILRIEYDTEIYYGMLT